MLILCDFDGTITERDVTGLVWSTRIPKAERDAMAQRVLEGQWSMLEYMAHGYSYVQTPPTELLQELHAKVQVRRGWDRFLAAVHRHRGHLHIVSNGLKFYVREFVSKSVPVICYDADFVDGYRVSLPLGFELSPGEEFKVKCARELMAGYRQKRVVYIGDGRADFQAALLCDTIFAVRESRLAAECRAHAIGMVEFESFDTVTHCLFPKLAAELGA